MLQFNISSTFLGVRKSLSLWLWNVVTLAAFVFPFLGPCAIFLANILCNKVHTMSASWPAKDSRLLRNKSGRTKPIRDLLEIWGSRVARNKNAKSYLRCLGTHCIDGDVRTISIWCSNLMQHKFKISPTNHPRSDNINPWICHMLVDSLVAKIPIWRKLDFLCEISDASDRVHDKLCSTCVQSKNLSQTKSVCALLMINSFQVIF